MPHSSSSIMVKGSMIDGQRSSQQDGAPDLSPDHFGVTREDGSEEEDAIMRDVELADQTMIDPDGLESLASRRNVDDDTMQHSSVVAATPAAPSAGYSDPQIMYTFYQRLFPFRYLFQWLNHSMKPSNDFAHREFAFTLQNDAYLRYQSFATGDLFRKDVLRLNPSRFEIGPVYSTNPRDRKTLRKNSAFKPVSKELVFDIDLTDYDEVRTCCSQADICQKCWAYIAMAIRVVDTALREDFGFMHILWVYSGRRGAHAWVSDLRARNMDDSRRKAIAGYLDLLKGGDKVGKKVNIKRSLQSSDLHPHIVRSLEILKPYFAHTVLQVQDPFSSEAGAERLLALLPDRNLNDALRKKWHADPGRSSSAKWADINTLAEAGVSRNLDRKLLLEAKQDIVLEYTYPRLDIEVSKKLNHLLKSPFVVHPKTGRVCVPIDPTNVDDFDPFDVPTVTNLLHQVDQYDQSPDSGKASRSEHCQGEGQATEPTAVLTAFQDYEKTSLKPFIDYFKLYVHKLTRTEQGPKRESGDEGMDF